MFARLRPYLPVAVLAFLIFYFGFQALTGDRGLLAPSQRNELLAQKRGELARLQAQRKDLEARARLMRDGQVSRAKLSICVTYRSGNLTRYSSLREQFANPL